MISPVPRKSNALIVLLLEPFFSISQVAKGISYSFAQAANISYKKRNRNTTILSQREASISLVDQHLTCLFNFHS